MYWMTSSRRSCSKSAYFLKGVVPQWEMRDIYAGMVQFMILQLVGVGLLLIFPKLATWLPSVN